MEKAFEQSFIENEIKDNGELNGIDINNHDVINRIAQALVSDDQYEKEIRDLQFSDFKPDDKDEKFYEIIWQFIDKYK